MRQAAAKVAFHTIFKAGTDLITDLEKMPSLQGWLTQEISFAKI